MKKQKKHQNSSVIDEKLKNKSLTFLVSFFSCDLQDFKFYYVNCKVLGATILHWVDFMQSHSWLFLRVYFKIWLGVLVTIY